MTIDINAIRQRADRYKQTGDGIGKTIQAIQLANTDIPALLAEVERLRTEFAELKAALHHLTVSTDGDDLDDAEEIPVGEIRRVVGEAGDW